MDFVRLSSSTIEHAPSLGNGTKRVVVARAGHKAPKETTFPNWVVRTIGSRPTRVTGSP